jgi:hypothetical protein
MPPPVPIIILPKVEVPEDILVVNLPDPRSIVPEDVPDVAPTVSLKLFSLKVPPVTDKGAALAM